MVAQCGQVRQPNQLQLTKVDPPKDDAIDAWAFEGSEESLTPRTSVFSISTSASDDEGENSRFKLGDFRHVTRVKHTFLEFECVDATVGNLSRPRLRRSSSDSSIGRYGVESSSCSQPSEIPSPLAELDVSAMAILPSMPVNFTATWDPFSAPEVGASSYANIPAVEHSFLRIPSVHSETSLEDATPSLQQSRLTTSSSISWSDTDIAALDTHWVPPADHQSGHNAGAKQLDEKCASAGSQQIPIHAKNCFDASVPQVPDNERTTLMIRNLPKEYSRDMLLELLDAEGFSGTYNFVYMPMDFEKDVSFSYAFVNFVTHEGADKVRDHLQGFTHWCLKSPKICDAAWSGPHQGYMAHIDRFRNSPVMHEDVPDKYKPTVYEGGVRVAFPAATKRIRKPRMRHQTTVQSSLR